MTRLHTQPTRAGHLSLMLLSLVFIGAGALHFARPQPYDGIVPTWAAPGLFPSARSVTLISGAAEMLGGLGLLLPGTRPAARWGLVLLLIAVFPANLEMAQQAEKYPLPAWALWARLPLQLPLIWWVLSAGKTQKKLF